MLFHGQTNIRHWNTKLLNITDTKTNSKILIILQNTNVDYKSSQKRLKDTDFKTTKCSKFGLCELVLLD